MVKRGRRTREAGSQVAELARDAGRQRIVYRQGNSWVVALPLWARRSLDRVEGGAVYWHDLGRGALILSDSPTRARGHAVVTDMQRGLDKLRRENDKLRHQLQARPLKVLNEGKSAGYSMALRHYARLDGDVQAVAEKVDRLASMLAASVLPRRRALRQPRSSAPTPPPDSSAGEAVTPGAEPTGHP